MWVAGLEATVQRLDTILLRHHGGNICNEHRMKFGFYTIPGFQLLNQTGVEAQLLGSKRGHFMLTLNLTFLGSLNHDMLRIVKKMLDHQRCVLF